jgi:hypothetical protein
MSSSQAAIIGPTSTNDAVLCTTVVELECAMSLLHSLVLLLHTSFPWSFLVAPIPIF